MTAAEEFIFSNRMMSMTCTFESEGVGVIAARVEEGLSGITQMTVEFICRNRGLSLDDVVGTAMTISIKTETEDQRNFSGTIVSAESLGLYQGFGLYTVEIRPWLWFLTRTRENRIYQDMTAPDIIKEIFSDYGFGSNVTDNLSGGYPTREYCVQYDETDFDFICRLMEEEGIYFFFTYEDSIEKIVLAEGAGAHGAVPNSAEIEFNFREMSLTNVEFRRRNDHIYEWTAKENIVGGKVTLGDYNMKVPGVEKVLEKIDAVGSHSRKNYEHYKFPGHFVQAQNSDQASSGASGAAQDDSDVADRYARIRLESLKTPHQRWTGLGNVRTMGVGQTFKLKDHPRVNDSDEFLIVSAVHMMQVDTDYEDLEKLLRQVGRRLDFDNNDDTYRCVFEVQPKATQYRAPQVTPWPRIPGMQTALVVGPSGEEIHTDGYGRILVQFHWDRLGRKDENSSCWVRCVMPWTGKNWGMYALPRIHQEVAIMFLEGDPDRPICTGMFYNQDTLPPYELPTNKTQTGIVTRSTKSGSATTFHELIFEDKKDAEFIRLQSERDYKETIKNNAEITIGLEHQDDGDLTQTIHRHKTETLNTGDMTFTVSEGNEVRSIATDQTEDIGNDRTQSIGNDSSVSISNNSTLDVGSNLDETIGADMSTSVGSNLTVEAGTNIDESAGTNFTMEAGTKIELKVGGSKIEITSASIKVTSPMIQINGSTTTEVKGGVSLILKGGMTMIN